MTQRATDVGKAPPPVGGQAGRPSLSPTRSPGKGRTGEVIRPSLRIGVTGGAAEDAAERTAQHIVSARPAAAAPASADFRRLVQNNPSPEASSAGHAPAVVHDVLATEGRPMDAATRNFMETRFDRDFSAVRVHTDARSADSARAVQAAAYTVGNDLVFGNGTYQPDTLNGQRILAHELTHVVQQGATGRGILQRTPDQPGEKLVGAPKKTCEDSLDITEVFRGFMRNYPKAIAAMPDLTAEQRQGYQAMLDVILKNEGGVDVMKWTVLSCKKINLDLAVGDETFSAYFSSADKTIGLSQPFVTKLTTALQDKEAFLDTLSVLAHEKRHATLGSSVSVPLSALKGDPTESKAQNAAYRVEEIMAVTEEIAVRRLAVGSDYEVPEKIQRQFYRLSNQMRNWVNEDEAKRLRKLVIDKLRERYGFTDGCDTALTVGVVRCMDHNEWFSCDRANHTIYGKIPEGLHICTDEKHAFCREKEQPAKP